MVWEPEPRALHMPGKLSTTELHFQLPETKEYFKDKGYISITR